MPSYSSDRFLEEYEPGLDKEFEYDGRTSRWAPGVDGPRYWDEEDDMIQLVDDGQSNANVAEHAMALTTDSRYLALSANAVIRIYDVESLVLYSEVPAHKDGVSQMFFVKLQESGYRLFASSHDDDKVHIWDIGHEGHLPTELKALPFSFKDLANRAVQTIAGDLQARCGLDETEVKAVRNGFIDGLKNADAQRRINNIPTLDGSFPGFGSQPLSHDGTKILYVAHGRTTQHGMRPPSELPQIVVIDVATQEHKCRLMGHEDAIMWAGWSLDDEIIATASWDKTYRIWDARTGECIHVIGKTGGQNWAGAFLSDGKHVVLSGGRPVNVGVYSIETAAQVAHLEAPEEAELDDWMRYFTAHPSENILVLQNGLTLLAWNPTDPGSATRSDVQEIFALTRDPERIKNRFAAVLTLHWVDDGEKLVAKATDQTVFIWDVSKGVKWRFQRPKGRKADTSSDVLFATRNGADWVVSLDGDGKVRFWKL